MELYFQHLMGKMVDMDVAYSPVKATFFPDEWEWAVQNGWLMNEWDPPFWFQGRQVRLDLRIKRKPFKFNPNLKFSVGKVDNLHRLDRIWYQYKEKRGFDDHLDFRDTCDFEPDNKRIIRIFHGSRLIAFSIIRIYPFPVSLQFAWNYENPSLSAGIESQYFEIEYFKKMGYNYLYLCPGYESVCIWKKRFPGFQFWTGSKWLDDRVLYEDLCESDSSIRTIEQLSELSDIDDDPTESGITSRNSTWSGASPRPY